MARVINLTLIYLLILCVRLFFILQMENNLRKFAGNQIKYTGLITSEPKLQGSTQMFNVGRVRVVTTQFPRYLYGSDIEIIGNLESRLIGKFYRQFSLMYPDIKETIPDSKKNFLTWFSRGAINLRTEVEKIYNHYLGEPEASLLSGIVLGVKRGLPQEFADSLQKTGTLHIIVASGYNVTIIIGTIITLIAGLIRRQWAILIGILAVFGYTIMAGAEPAIVRAAIMGSLAYFGQVLGKQSEGIRLLVVAGLTMILVNPFFLLDLGFQLSFMATLGLLLMADHFPQVIAETTAAQIMVWPIILINFGQLSLFSILVNILILWLVPYIMVLGAALALVGWIKPVGAVLGMIAYLPLHLMTVIINWFGEQSWISWQLEGVSWIFGALYYLILGAVLIKLNHVNPKKVV